jgi:hypothetical protein
VLVGEQLGMHQAQSRLSARDVLIHAFESPRRTSVGRQHAYILLTQHPLGALPAGVRTHLASRKVTVLSPSCTIGDLLGAVEDAIERLAASLPSALARSAVATALQQCNPDTERQINGRSTEQGQVVAGHQRTTPRALVQVDSACDAISTPEQLLRNGLICHSCHPSNQYYHH